MKKKVAVIRISHEQREQSEFWILGWLGNYYVFIGDDDFQNSLLFPKLFPCDRRILQVSWLHISIRKPQHR